MDCESDDTSCVQRGRSCATADGVVLASLKSPASSAPGHIRSAADQTPSFLLSLCQGLFGLALCIFHLLITSHCRSFHRLTFRLCALRLSSLADSLADTVSAAAPHGTLSLMVIAGWLMPPLSAAAWTLSLGDRLGQRSAGRFAHGLPQCRVSRVQSIESGHRDDRSTRRRMHPLGCSQPHAISPALPESSTSVRQVQIHPLTPPRRSAGLQYAPPNTSFCTCDAPDAIGT